MKKNKLNPELLKEELNKFKLLLEYDFYQEKKELPEYKDLLLGDKELDEADKAPKDLEPTDTNTDAEAKDIANDLGVDDTKDNDSGEESGDIPEPETTDTETSEPISEPKEDNSDDVEIDVTSLVKGSKAAKEAADKASNNTAILMQKLSKLEAHVANMDKISSKIEDLEKEIIKRNPTPVEKLEMRSLSSYPYSQKLSDYWVDKKGPYDVMDNDKKKKEYVLTKDDVDSNYSDNDIKKSFSVKPDEYDEEDVKDYDE